MQRQKQIQEEVNLQILQQQEQSIRQLEVSKNYVSLQIVWKAEIFCKPIDY